MRDVQQPSQEVYVLPGAQAEVVEGSGRGQAAAVIVGSRFVQSVDDGDGKRAYEVGLTGGAGCLRTVLPGSHMHALGI
jgi:hypothetical protein